MADSKDLKKMVAANLRSVTQSCKGGVPFECLERDYRDLLGVTIPYSALGYSSLEAMIKAMPDVVRLQRNAAGKYVVMAVADETTAHIASLIARQKSAVKRPTRSKRPDRVRRTAVVSSKSSSVRHFNKGTRAPPSYLETASHTRSNKSDSSVDRVREAKRTVPVAPQRGGERVPSVRTKVSSTFGPKYEVPPRFLRKQEKPLSSLENNSAEDDFTPSATSAESYSSQESVYFVPPPTCKPVPKPEQITYETDSRSAREFIEIYARRNNLKTSYHTVRIGQKRKSYVSVLTLGDVKYNLYPDAKDTVEEAEESVAERAREAVIQSEGSQKLLPVVAIEDPMCLDSMLTRIEQIVAEYPKGIWNTSIPTVYEEKHQERLPEDWFPLVQESCSFYFEKVDVSRIILYPGADSGRVSPASSLTSDQDFESRIEDLEGKLTYVPDLKIPDSDQFDVFVSNVQEDGFIAVRFLEYAESFANLSEKMMLFYQKNKYPVSSVSTKKPYAVFLDELWHRALVREIKGDKVVCQLVDEGDYVEVDINSLQEMDPNFLELAFQMCIFRLAELDSYSAFIKPETLKDYLLGKTLVARLVDWESSDIILFDTSTDEDINLNRIIFEKTVAESLCYTLPECGASAMAYLSHVSPCGIVYLSLNSASTTNLLLEELDRITPICEEKAKLGCDTSKARIYCAKYDVDGHWYRAIILDTAPERNAAEVLYVDYGNTSWVSTSSVCELKPISEYLAKLPFQAVRCTLSELPPRNLYWNEDVTRRMGELFALDKELIVRVQKPGTETELPEVALFIRNDQSQIVSINQTLALDEHLFSSVPCDKSDWLPDWTKQLLSKFNTKDYRPIPSSPYRSHAACSSPSQRENATNGQEDLSDSIIDVSVSAERREAKQKRNRPITSPTNGNECDNEAEQFPPLYPPDVPKEGSFFNVFVTMAATPFNFMCQPLKSSKDLDQLISEMQSFYSNEENLCEMHSVLVRKGEFFAGKHVDGCWYRVRKQRIVSEDPLQVSVYYVDFGDICIMPLPNLQPLFKQFKTLPCQCMKASLKGVKPNGRDWDTMECIEFKKMVTEKQFSSTVERRELVTEDHLPVYSLELILIDVSDPKVDVYVHEELIKKNLAQPDK